MPSFAAVFDDFDFMGPGKYNAGADAPSGDSLRVIHAVRHAFWVGWGRAATRHTGIFLWAAG